MWNLIPGSLQKHAENLANVVLLIPSGLAHCNDLELASGTSQGCVLKVIPGGLAYRNDSELACGASFQMAKLIPGDLVHAYWNGLGCKWFYFSYAATDGLPLPACDT